MEPPRHATWFESRTTLNRLRQNYAKRPYFNADGSYTFDASSYDSLNDGEPLVLTIPFTATDENAAVSSVANLVITITGTNDVPVAVTAVPAVAEDLSRLLP